eukprot:6375136-Amphidinium_carterae.1
MAGHYSIDTCRQLQKAREAVQIRRHRWQQTALKCLSCLACSERRPGTSYEEHKLRVPGDRRTWIQSAKRQANPKSIHCE